MVVVTDGSHMMELLTRAQTRIAIVLVKGQEDALYAKQKEYFQQASDQGLIDILSDGSDMQPKNTWEELAFYLQQVMDKNFKEQLNTILKVKESSSFEEFFESLGSATEKDIALVLIHQATVLSPFFKLKCNFFTNMFYPFINFQSSNSIFKCVFSSTRI